MGINKTKDTAVPLKPKSGQIKRAMVKVPHKPLVEHLIS